MQKLQDSVFSIVKTTSLSSAVFSFLQPTEECSDQTPLGGILRDTKYGWLGLGRKFCVVDLRSGLKIAARTFGNSVSNKITITSVVELPTPLTENSQQLVISLECDHGTGLICIFHINGSQLLRCIQTDTVITELAVCDGLSSGPLMCFDGLVMAGTRRGEIIIFDLNKSSLMQALKDISQGNEDQVKGEQNVSNLLFLPLKAIHKIEDQRDLAVENDDHLALLLNENSFLDNQYIFCNPDGTVRMKAKQSNIRTTVVQYISQLGSLAVGFNFGAFQLWNLLNLELEFTSQVNVECLPITHFGFQEPCDDPRAFCYLWVVFSVTDRFEEEEFSLAVMYSLTYQGKRMLSDSKCLYQEFSSATIRFQLELGAVEDMSVYIGGRCISCHTYSVSSILGDEGEDTKLNLCQLVWECWGDNRAETQHCMILFDLDQWYKDQMPATCGLENNAFISTARCPDISRGSCLTLDLRLDPESVSPYSHATRLEEHFYPNSLQYNCVSLNTSEASVLQTVGVQRQVVRAISAAGPACLLSPAHMHAACCDAGLAPLYAAQGNSTEDERRFLLSVALEARLSRFLKRCAHDWATGTHSGVGCTLPFLIDWSWRRAIELKENAKDLTLPLFTSSTLPDRNVIRCLEHCVQQLSQLTGLLDSVLTKCCNLVVPDALSEMEEKYKGIGTVSLYFQVVQWFVRVGLLPEKSTDRHTQTLPYPVHQLCGIYNKRRIKLNRLQDKSEEEESRNKFCSLLYIDQLIEHEFGGDRVNKMWARGGGDCGVYPPQSLFSLLRLYLLPDVSDEHKHSLLLYLLLDYSMIYDDMRHEAVIRRLMQFPTMFGLSNTAIKATQAFWHLDHRDFDFALDQLQCLTGNTLTDWQHHVVLSSLLAQKKTQSALQYLHVRKPAPIHVNDNNDYDKLDDWQTSCNLYLARGLVCEAFDVIRMCVENAGNVEDKMHLLNYFYKGCRNTGQLSKVLQITLLPFEEKIFIKYLQDCNEPQTSDILVMYYLQQARYLEAEQYNNKLKCRSSSLDERGGARDALVTVMCRDLPDVTGAVLACALTPLEPRVFKPKPMSVYVQANSPINTFTYKSSFIQDTIENASETWTNKPKTRKGIKRALNIEETPFICTPKCKSVLQDKSESTPAKRAKLVIKRPPRTLRMSCKASATLSQQMASLLDMPELESPHRYDMRPDTKQSILKSRPSSRRSERGHDHDNDHSDHDHDHSDHDHDHDEHRLLRFTIPTSSEAGSTPSPVAMPLYPQAEVENSVATLPESPPKKLAAEEITPPKKTYKDNVRARRSLSISANSSLSEDPSTSLESIADIPVTLINLRYKGERRTRDDKRELEDTQGERETEEKTEGREKEVEDSKSETFDTSYVPQTPKGRRGIRNYGRETLVESRNRSRTSDPSPRSYLTPSPRSYLNPIEELPRLETDNEPYKTTLVPTTRRSRLCTPEKLQKVMEAPHLETIIESPIKSPIQSPARRSLRSRSRTPEVDTIVEPPSVSTPRSLRSRSKTPEKLMSPKKDHGTRKKSLSRIVLEANAFAKTKQIEKMDTEDAPETSSIIECTPMEPSKNPPSLIDVSFSPIVKRSILDSLSESYSITEKSFKTSGDNDNALGINQLPAFTTINEMFTEQSVLHSYQSSIGNVESKQEAHNGEKCKETLEIVDPIKSFASMMEDYRKSVLNSVESTIDASNTEENREQPVKFNKDYDILSTGNSVSESKQNNSLMTSESEIEVNADWSQLESQDARVIQKEKERIVEIEREIHEIEGEMSDDCQMESSSESNESVGSEQESVSENVGNEIFFIEDTDDSSDTYKLQIDEELDAERTQEEQIIAGTSEDIVTENIPEASHETEAEIQATFSVLNENKVKEKGASSEVFQAPEILKFDQLNQTSDMSILTDDNSVLETEQSISLNYSDKKKNEKEAVAVETVQTVAMAIEDKMEECKGQQKTENKDVVIETEKKGVSEKSEAITEGENTDKVQKTRKRTNSTFTKSKEETDATEKIEPKTPRRRRQSSSKSEVEETPERLQNTPKSRAKTPTSEIRQILTRRASKELEKMDESSTKLEDLNVELTPRRSSRRSKRDDDNASVTSDSSVKSGRSRASEEEVKISARKGRTRVLSVRSDLPVIPEVAADKSETAPDDSIKEYFIARRLTRKQKAVLDNQLESDVPQRRLDHDSDSSLTRTDYDGSPDRERDSDSETAIRPQRIARASSERKGTPRPARIGRRISADVGSQDRERDSDSETAIRPQRIARASSERKGTPRPARIGRRISADVGSQDRERDSDSETAIRPQRIARASSERKGTPRPARIGRRISADVGSPDRERDSDSETAIRPQRIARASSERKGTPRPARIGRRISADVVVTPEAGTPLASQSPGRRASFKRACEALHNTKRRGSTDVKDSPMSEEATPRRVRRPSASSVKAEVSTPRSKKAAEKID